MLRGLTCAPLQRCLWGSSFELSGAAKRPGLPFLGADRRMLALRQRLEKLHGQNLCDFFAAHTKLEGVADRPVGHAAVQRDFDRLENWGDRNLIKFSKGKYKALHLGRNSPMQEQMLGPPGWLGLYSPCGSSKALMRRCFISTRKLLPRNAKTPGLEQESPAPELSWQSSGEFPLARRAGTAISLSVPPVPHLEPGSR